MHDASPEPRMHVRDDSDAGHWHISVRVSTAQGRWDTALPQAGTLFPHAIRTTLSCMMADTAKSTARIASACVWYDSSRLPHAARSLEVGLLLTGESEMQTLNRQYRCCNRPTNVLAFPCQGLSEAGSGRLCLLGDVALGLETVQKESRALGISLAAHAGHLVVHGVLHLLGYDHHEDQAAQRMACMEKRVLEEIFGPENQTRGMS